MSPFTLAEIDSMKKELFLMPPGTYLSSHSVGCLTKRAQADFNERFFRPWQERGAAVWGGWLDEVQRFCSRVGRLIGGRTEAICPQTNVSGAVSKILHGLPARAGRDRLVLCEEDFPSLGFVLDAARRVGYQTVFLPRGAAVSDPDTWHAALDDRVQLALVTHAFSNRSVRLPVAQITRIARERGVFSVVDATQTLGVIPIDVREWSADFLVGSSVKFLCGGPGAAFLWAAEEASALAEPIDTGWFSHRDPFAFDIHDFKPAAGALRFWGGTPSVAPYVIAAGALDLLHETGIAAIEEHNQGLITSLHSLVPPPVIGSETARERRGNVVLLRVRDEAAARNALQAQRIHADFREGCVRVSPHLYNDRADIARLADTLSAHF